MKISNPHDKFFKETFSHVEVVQDFVQHYLPPVLVNLINLNSFKPQKETYINEKLQEQFSDLLFQCNINDQEGYIYFLFEHKSFVSKTISFQVLRYMVEIWEAKMTKEKTEKLPIIIPLIVYHGKDNWHLHPTLGDMIEGYTELPVEVQQYVPNFAYILHDLTDYKEEDIKLNARLKILQLMFRDIFSKAREGFQKSIMRDLDDQSSATQYLETWMRYVFHAARNLTEHDFRDIIEHIEKTFPEGSEVVMTLAELFEEKGIKKGRQEGIHALANATIKLITKYIDTVPKNMSEQIKKQDITTLETIIENVFEMQTLNDVKKHLK